MVSTKFCKLLLKWDLAGYNLRFIKFYKKNYFEAWQQKFGEFSKILKI